MKKFNIRYLLKSSIIVLVMAVFSGCVAVQPFPNVVRAGDTITLAIGSLDGANRSNVTVNYYADSNPTVAIDMTSDVRSLLKIFPDKTSSAYWDTESGAGVETMSFQSISSNHGPWQSVIVLDLPITTPSGVGHFEVTFGVGVSYPNLVTKVDDVNIGMEVLSDINGDSLAGAAHDFLYRKIEFNTFTNSGDLLTLEPLPQVIVKLEASSTRPLAPAAAASYDVTVPVLDSLGADVSDQVFDDQFTVVLDDQSDYLRNQVSLNWNRVGKQFKVVITSLNGQQDFNKIRYSILIIDETLNVTNGWILGTPSLISAQLFDLNGNDITASLTMPDVILR